MFRKIDIDDSKTIDKDETKKFWWHNFMALFFEWIETRKSNYAKLNTDLLFQSVDADGNGTISVDEWLLFWEEVRRAGYSEKQINQEVVSVTSFSNLLVKKKLDSLMQGNAWVKFKNVGEKMPGTKSQKSKNY